MTQYKNVTKKDFVFIIDCIKALEAKIEAGGFPRGQELAEQLSDTMLSLLEVAMGDTEVHNIETWLFYPELASTVIKVDGKWRDWSPETSEALYDWLTGVYNSPEDELDEGEEANEIF